MGEYPSPTTTGEFYGSGVRLYQVSTGAKVWELDGVKLAEASKIYDEKFFCDAIFSPDGKWVAAFQYRNKSVLLLDAVTGREIRRLPFRGIPSNRYVPPALAFSPDGKRLFARGESVVLVWDLKSKD